jgi:hypothetical protein
MTTTEITETEYDHTTAELTVGMTLPNGETIVSLRKLDSYRLCGDGNYNYHQWKVVAVRGGNNFHNYVVRSVSAMPTGWSVSGGDYMNSIVEALTKIGVAQ